MKLLDVVKAAGDRVGASGQYMWKSFGDNAISIDFNDTDGNDYASAVFDTTSQEVCCVTIEVPGCEQAFRWIAPHRRVAYYEECVKRGVDPDIAYDLVQYTHVDTEELILEYVKDIGETYYDNLPISANLIPTLDEFIDQPAGFTMPMPGTAGGATYSFGDGFQNEKKMDQFKVKLLVQMDYSVNATSMDEAAEKARKWLETSKVFHGDGDGIYWEDRSVVEESVSRAVEE